ncbi:MAG: (d)CMP kinase [Firmicutes bacterium]|nr:(d)CMP kinase [Bacillota bacterium]
MNDLIVIGAGAAGMMAASAAAREKIDVLLIEKNARVGRKIGITGKGRCNVTNNCDEKTYIENVVNNPRFMYSAIRKLNPSDMMELISSEGVRLKTERGGRVFPESDKAFDIIDALYSYVKKSGVKLLTGKSVSSIRRSGKEFEVTLDSGEIRRAGAVVLSTGGLSYPTTGSTGDGHRIAQKLGISLIAPRPALIPLVSSDHFCRDLMGLSLKNVEVRLSDDTAEKGKTIYSDFGEMLFTHFGVSGPVVLSCSSYLSRYLRNEKASFSERKIVLHIDLKSALDTETLDQRLQRDFTKYSAKDFINALGDLLPKRMIPVIVRLSGIDREKKAGQISRDERRRLIQLLKDFPVRITGTRPLDEAIITSGGIDVNEIHPGTMMIRKIPGLFVAGELIDVDCLTGGFNLQTAFSTGKAAGLGAAQYIQKERNRKMLNVAIDGPGGAGKSSVARKAAEREGLQYVDSGALYRAIGYVLVRGGIDVEDQAKVEQGIRSMHLSLFYQEDGQHVTVDGEDVTAFLRTAEAGQGASKVAVHGKVRDLVNSVIRETAKIYDVIMDGRDIGTVVLPDANLKLFITASSEERAKRRLLEFEAAGKPHGDLETVKKEIEERDYRDSHREIAPLKQAEDAVLIDTTMMNLEEVVEKVCGLIQEARK